MSNHFDHSPIARYAVSAALLLISLAGFHHDAVALDDPHTAAQLRDAYLAVSADLEPYRNAVHLYLRIAGIIWIAVEWIAAIVLIRAHSIVRRHFTEPLP